MPFFILGLWLCWSAKGMPTRCKCCNTATLLQPIQKKAPFTKKKQNQNKQPKNNQVGLCMSCADFSVPGFSYIQFVLEAKPLSAVK